MTPAAEQGRTAEAVERAAARWFARHRSGEMSEAEGAAMQAWLDADAAHRFAYDTVARAWARTGLMRTTPEVLQLRARHRRPFSRLRHAVTSRAFAASVAGAVLALTAIGGGRLWLVEMKRLPDATYQTAVGEQRTIVLNDGSQVTLNTDTVVRTRRSGDRRLLYLDRGQAFFRVAHDPAHPFIVSAAGRTVTALGTAFDVRVDQGRFEVVLVEGRVKVESPLTAVPRDPAAGRDEPPKPQAAELVAGTELVAVNDSDWRVSQADIRGETAWVTGWLRFDADPLSDVVAELGRYSPRRIVLEDAELAHAPISGRFKPEDQEAFLRALETYGIAEVRAETADEIRLAAPEQKSSRRSMGG